MFAVVTSQDPGSLDEGGGPAADARLRWKTEFHALLVGY